MNEEKKVPFKWEYGEETISLQLGMYANSAKPHGAEKSIGVTCEQDIITAILSGFDDNRIFHDIVKRMRWRAYLLRCFMI